MTRTDEQLIDEWTVLALASRIEPIVYQMLFRDCISENTVAQVRMHSIELARAALTLVGDRLSLEGKE